MVSALNVWKDVVDRILFSNKSQISYNLVCLFLFFILFVNYIFVFDYSICFFLILCRALCKLCF